MKKWLLVRHVNIRCKVAILNIIIEVQKKLGIAVVFNYQLYMKYSL